MGGGGQVEARATGFEGEHHERRFVTLLERPDDPGALPDGSTAVQHESRPAEGLFEEAGQWPGHFAKLREHDQLVLARRDRLAQLSETHELAAVAGLVLAVSEPLRGMIADLLEAHQEGQHDAASFDARELPQNPPHLVDGFMVEGRLVLAEQAMRGDLGLVRQVGDHAPVGLEAAEDVGPDEPAKRRIGVVFSRRHGPAEAGEGPGGAQKPRVQEVEDRP